MMKPSWLAQTRGLSATLLLAALSLTGCAFLPGAPTEATSRHFEAIRSQPEALNRFLRAFPKGADLHNHLSGAIYAESFIRWAARDGECIDRVALALTPPPCNTGTRVPAIKAQTDKALDKALIESLSMQDFVPGKESGHDHFFATFDKFGAASHGHDGDMLAEAVERAAEDHVLYVELMLSPGMNEARQLGAKLGWRDDFAKQRDRLITAGMDDIVGDATQAMNSAEKEMRAKLHCEEPAQARPGCRVEIRYLAQIIRTFPREQVFAEDVLAFQLVEADKRFVGLNMVAPEDDPVSLRDYTLHMKMLGFLHGLDSKVQMSLHAGELVPGLGKPEDLRFHIKQAVEIAGAERIGHGVDITHEDDYQALLAEMAANRVMVEINLTSNDLILGVRGAAHPFPLYRSAGVPTALSTDDEGVSRIDLTHEYVRAAQEFSLSYRDMKALSRNSLEYAFLPGPSLWKDARDFTPVNACAGDQEPMTKDCATFLAQSEKAREQWHLEAAFAAFEAANP